MSLATILPKSSTRILVRGQLAARRRTDVGWRRNVQCSGHRVTPLRCVSGSIRIRICVGVSVPVSVLSTVGLGSVGTGPRAKRMGGLSVGILRSDFAMLQKQKWRQSKTRSVGYERSRERYLAVHCSRVSLRASSRTEVVQYSRGGVEPLGMQVAILRA